MKVPSGVLYSQAIQNQHSGALGMATERTLSIIKPDAVKKHVIGDIVARYEKAGLKPVAMRMMQFSKLTAQGFYAVHKARPFFDSLCTFMVWSGCGAGPPG